MIIKILSSVAIVLCCSLLGRHMAYRYIRRTKNIKILQSILTHLEAEILHYSTFLPEALKNSTRNAEGEWGEFFMDLGGLLDGEEQYFLHEAWETSLEKLRTNPYIGNGEYEIMYRFGLQLGSSDKDSQEKYFKLVHQQLKKEETNAEETLAQYAKMYRSLGILLGLCIAIILF